MKINTTKCLPTELSPAHIYASLQWLIEVENQFEIDHNARDAFLLGVGLYVNQQRLEYLYHEHGVSDAIIDDLWNIFGDIRKSILKNVGVKKSGMVDENSVNYFIDKRYEIASGGKGRIFLQEK